MGENLIAVNIFYSLLTHHFLSVKKPETQWEIEREIRDGDVQAQQPFLTSTVGMLQCGVDAPQEGIINHGQPRDYASIGNLFTDENALIYSGSSNKFSIAKRLQYTDYSIFSVVCQVQTVQSICNSCPTDFLECRWMQTTSFQA